MPVVKKEMGSCSKRIIMRSLALVAPARLSSGCDASSCRIQLRRHIASQMAGLGRREAPDQLHGRSKCRLRAPEGSRKSCRLNLPIMRLAACNSPQERMYAAAASRQGLAVRVYLHDRASAREADNVGGDREHL